MSRAVVLLREVNSDPTLVFCSVAARLVFVSLLPELDADGRLDAARGLTIEQTVSALVRLAEDVVVVALDDLGRLEFIRREPRRITVPRFRKRQDEGLRLLLEQRGTDAPPTAHAPAAAPAAVVPPPTVPSPTQGQRGALRRPDDRRLVAPLLPGESPADRERRLKRDRQNAKRRAGRIPTTDVASDLEVPPQTGGSLAAQTGGSKPEQPAQTGGSTADSPRAFPENPDSGTSENVVNELDNPPSSAPDPIRGGIDPLPAQTTGSEPRASAVEPTTRTTGSGSDLKLSAPRPVPQAPHAADGQVGQRAWEIFSALVAATSGKFSSRCAPEIETQLVKVDARFAVSGDPEDRWTILGEYIMAGGFSDLKARRYRRGDIAVPDMNFFIIHCQVPNEHGGVSPSFNTSRLESAMTAALGWHADGRPTISAQSPSRFREAVARSEAPTTSEGARAAREMVAAGGKSKGTATSMSGAELAALGGDE